MKILSRLERSYEFWLLLILALVFFFLRLPSLTEPYWYGDEGIYYAIAMALQDGKLLYTDIWDNKPPLLYILYTVFSSDQFYIRLASLLFGISTIILFFNLAKNLLRQKRATTVSVILFTVLFGLPLLEGNIANAENFMLLPVIAAMYIFYSSLHQENRTRKYKDFLVGVLLGVAFLIKIVAIFDLTALIVFYFFFRLRNEPLQFRKIWDFFLERPLYLIAGFLMPFFTSILFFFLQGNLAEYINAIFFQNIGYVGKENALIIPQGLLILKVLLLSTGLLFIFWKRQLLPQNILFIITWFVFAYFSASFSGRPYTHYLLVLLPSFCLGVGLFFLLPRLRIRFTIAALVIIILLLLNFDFYLARKTIPYYVNYIRFITNTMSVDEYRAFFDRSTPRDYDLAAFLKTRNKEDLVYLWGDNPQVYKLAEKTPPGKYTVAYHVVTKNAIDETTKMLNEKKPKYFIAFPNVPQIPFSLTNYRYIGTIQNTDIYERIN